MLQHLSIYDGLSELSYKFKNRLREIIMLVGGNMSKDKWLLNMNELLPLRDVVFNTLRQAILTGELKPGERLMEIHLANRLGVSRTPIREAMRKLELEGLVTMIPRRGAEVAQITGKSLQDVLEVRRSLDALCIELACERISEEDIARLGKACEHFKEATKSKDLHQIAEADVLLHDIIVQATQNKRLIQLVNNLSEQMYRYRFEYIKDSTMHENVIAEHELLYQAILNRDKVSAAKAAVDHIDNQMDTIAKHLHFEKVIQ